MLVTGFLPPLLHYPAQIVFPSFRRHIATTLSVIGAYECKSLFAPPKFIADMLNHPHARLASHLRYVQTVGQILTRDVVKSAFRKLPKLRFFVNNYGMTEILRTCFFVVRNEPEKENYRAADIPLGRALPFVELKVIETKSGELVPLGKVGELCVRSFSTLDSYWEDFESTCESLDANQW